MMKLPCAPARSWWFCAMAVSFYLGFALRPFDYDLGTNSIGTKTNTFRGSANNDATAKGQGFHPIHAYANEPDLPIQSYSQVGQDKIILKLIGAHTEKGGMSDNFFIDLAANDASHLSNTLHLEQMGWNGLCIEGNPIYWYKLSAIRKCTVVGAFVGGKTDGVQVEVKLDNGAAGGMVGDKFDNKQGDTKRNLVTISTVFKEMRAPDIIDYMSLDVEGAEYMVMKNFPFENKTIRLLTIERPSIELQELLLENGYKRNPKDFVVWGETLWFHPDSLMLSPEEVDELSNLSIEAGPCWVPGRDPGSFGPGKIANGTCVK